MRKKALLIIMMMNRGSCGFYAPFSLDGLASVGMFRIFVRMNLNSNLM